MKALLFTMSLVLLTACSRQEVKKEDPPVVSVRVAPVGKTNIPLVVRGPATVFPRKQANVTSRITAPIRELRAQKGDTVRAGQILAVLENSDLAAQREQSLSAVDDASANLQKTKAGTLPTDLEHARAQLVTSEAALAQARKNLERRRQLFSQGAISSKDLLQSQTDFSTAQANFDSARNSLDLLSKHSQEADLRIAQSRLRLAEAQVKGATAAFNFSEVRAPFSGRITEQFAYAGDIAQPAAPIFTAMDISRLIARAQISESDASSIRVGQKCRFLMGDSNQTTWPGRTTVVNAAVDPSRRTLESWCELSPPAQGLKAGLFGTVAVELGVVQNALTVPTAAVEFQEGSNRGSVLVVESGNIARVHEVETGEKAGDSVQIKTGLRAGGVVVVEGGYGLSDGAHVQIAAGNRASNQ